MDKINEFCMAVDQSPAYYITNDVIYRSEALLVDEDEDVFPVIEEKCPDCGDMVRDFRQHRCYW